MSKYVWEVLAHRRYVTFYLSKAANALFLRAAEHDNSKFTPEEMPIYEAVTPRFEGLAYGSAEYEAVKRELGPALDHHYQENDHHIEHFEAGISQMDMLQLLEWLSDRVARSKANLSNVYEGLQQDRERYKISDQLYAVLVNTASTLLNEESKDASH